MYVSMYNVSFVCVCAIIKYIFESEFCYYCRLTPYGIAFLYKYSFGYTVKAFDISTVKEEAAITYVK